MKMAEYRAARDALVKHFTQESKEFVLPDLNLNEPETLSFLKLQEESDKEMAFN